MTNIIIVGCEYGDRMDGCDVTRHCSFLVNWQACCYTCRDVIKDSSNTSSNTSSTPGTVAPSPAITTVTSSTKQTTAQPPTPEEPCEDDRMAGMSCNKFIATYGRWNCYNHDNVCCKTCRNMRSKHPGIYKRKCQQQ